MSTIDKQRITAVRKLEAMGYMFDGNEWQPPADLVMANTGIWVEADALHSLLVQRADALAGCTEGSMEEAVRFALTEAIDGYESNSVARGSHRRRQRLIAPERQP